MSDSGDVIKFPITDKGWMVRAKMNKLENASIHHKACASASKISEEQYLLLRSFWVEAGPAKKDPTIWGIKEIQEAAHWLGNEDDWKKYLDNLDNPSKATPVPRLGSFSYVSLARDQVTRLPEEYSEEEEDKNVSFSPISSRLRSSDPKQAPDGEDRPDSPAEDAARRMGISQTPPNMSSDEDTDSVYFKKGDSSKGGSGGDLSKRFEGINLGAESVDRATGKSPVGSLFEMTPNSSRKVFPKVEDEQIVNGFLIAFLATICMHNPNIKLEWSPVRKAFKFGKVDIQASGRKTFLFEARTDGHLSQPSMKNTNVRSAMIVEVKPTFRGYSNRVIYQATAQMAAWVYEEPDKPESKQPYRRAMVLQERHQIRLVIAKYDQKYIDYLHDKTVTDVSLLEMHEFGMWDIRVKPEMEEFGVILLALVLQDGKLIY
ncbi:hypothetical protein MferCBS31731_001424 [Microsporum ferrugineum]